MTKSKHTPTPWHVDHTDCTNISAVMPDKVRLILSCANHGEPLPAKADATAKPTPPLSSMP